MYTEVDKRFWTALAGIIGLAGVLELRESPITALVLLITACVLGGIAFHITSTVKSYPKVPADDAPKK